MNHKKPLILPSALSDAYDKSIFSRRQVESPIRKGPVLLRGTDWELAAQTARQPFAEHTINIRHDVGLHNEGGTRQSLQAHGSIT
jgi:hypothetical protein